MRVAVVMKVRDEESVLEENLRAHLALGADFAVVLDHLSQDSTPEILRRYERAGLAHVTRSDEEGYHEHETDWTTELARRAAELGADWVLHVDADEFWLPVAGDLKHALEQVDERYHAVMAPRVEFVARPDGPEPFYERMTVRERWSRVQPKIAHRAHPEVVIPTGPHRVIIPGTQGPTHAGRASLRAGREDIFSQSNKFTPTAPVWPVRILHFPLRSSQQFKRRAEIGIFGTGRETDRVRTKGVLEAWEAGRMEEAYAELVFDDDAVAAGIEAGELVEDSALSALLRECPDPTDDLAAAAAHAARRPQGGAEDAAELAQDAMQSLARTESLYYTRLGRQRERADRIEGRRQHQLERIEGLRERNARVKKKLRRTKRELKRTRRTRWWRLGSRLMSVPGLGRLLR